MTNPLILNGQILINQRVKVYRNLRKKLFSVLDNKTRRLISYQDVLFLSDVEFKVQKAGQKRVRRDKQKNVHAYVIGNYMGNMAENIEINNLVYYNPYVTDTFVIANNNKPIFKAEKCYLINGMCFVEKC
ncbi:hypothetical protein [Neobacillus ginsengisoli]|uniref:Uncharacterized protein n=1 Tax=Neobacillus ginsengisoli TaxID=904295 RepID=A0ABT9XZR6_9BACI|nr:hypothetical protein [Neobacillus ginsengisoli]MDQ0201062.1 hypothetical protein [Neobacillus ginsengisoli]